MTSGRKAHEETSWKSARTTWAMRSLVAASISGLVAIAAIASRTARPGAAGTAFRFPDGTAKAYRWSLTTTVSSERAGASAAHETAYDGTLNLRVLPGRATRTLV